jgi:drug/metabolite transporter (DMT)-like permease
VEAAEVATPHGKRGRRQASTGGPIIFQNLIRTQINVSGNQLNGAMTQTRTTAMTHFRANSFLLLAALFWGSGNVAQKVVLQGLGPLTAVGFRCLIGSIVVLPFVWHEITTSRDNRKLELRGTIEVALLFALAIVLQQSAFSFTTVTNASFLICTTTVMTPLAAWAMLKHCPCPTMWTAIIIAFIGTLLMSGGSLASFASGDVAILLSALAYSVWFVRLGQVVAVTGRPGLLTLAQFSMTGVLCLFGGVALEPFNASEALAVLPGLLFLGVFATGLAYGFQAMAQQKASANAAAILTSMESVFGAAAAMIFLGEHTSTTSWIGAVLVLAAVLTVQFGVSTETQLQPARSTRSGAIRSSARSWRQR